MSAEVTGRREWFDWVGKLQAFQTFVADVAGIIVLCAISGFRSEVGENRVLLSCYAANSGHSLPTFRETVSVPSGRRWKR